MKRPIRALFVLPDLGGGGAERVTLTLLRHFDRSRIQPTLFLLRREGVYWHEVPPDVRVYWGARSRLRWRYVLPRVLSALTAQAYRHDVVVGALELYATYPAFIAGKLARRPTIGWVHTMIDRILPMLPAWHQPAAAFVYPRLHRVVSPAMAAAQNIRTRYGLSPDFVQVIANPIDLESIDRRAAEGLPGWACPIYAKPVIIGVGRLDWGKGFDVLLRAHVALRRSGSDHHLLLLGDGELRDSLAAAAAEAGVLDSVFMPGFIENPYPFVAAATAFALSSRFEGLPTVVIEALALGIPIVSTDCQSGPAEILEGGRFGLLVPVDDAAELSRSLARVLAESKLRAHLASAGRTRARNYSPSTVVPHWERLLEDAVR